MILSLARDATGAPQDVFPYLAISAAGDGEGRWGRPADGQDKGRAEEGREGGRNGTRREEGEGWRGERKDREE